MGGLRFLYLSSFTSPLHVPPRRVADESVHVSASPDVDAKLSPKGLESRMSWGNILRKQRIPLGILDNPEEFPPYMLYLPRSWMLFVRSGSFGDILEHSIKHTGEFRAAILLRGQVGRICPYRL